MKAMKGINARRKPKPFEVQYFIKYRILQLKSVYNSGKGNCLKKYIYIFFFYYKDIPKIDYICDSLSSALCTSLLSSAFSHGPDVYINRKAHC